LKVDSSLDPYVPPFIPTRQAIQHDTEHSQMNQFSQFLLKKEILFSRFTTFDNQAESFLTWKSTFNSECIECDTIRAVKSASKMAWSNIFDLSHYH
jgi:hypothetical protein